MNATATNRTQGDGAMSRTEEALNRSRAKRSELIDQLGNGGVSDRAVLGHIETVERDIERLRNELKAN